MKLEVIFLWMVREGETEGHLIGEQGFACGKDTGEVTLVFAPSSLDEWEARCCPECAAIFERVPVGPIIVNTEDL